MIYRSQFENVYPDATLYAGFDDGDTHVDQKGWNLVVLVGYLLNHFCDASKWGVQYLAVRIRPNSLLPSLKFGMSCLGKKAHPSRHP